MQVRRLSTYSYWIEMPLTSQTCLLVWDAMFACGLRKGKINSYEDKHFGPLYEWQDHLVEGRTSEALFSEKTKIQAKLTEQEGGTLIEFKSANARNRLDLGTALSVRRRIVPFIMEFIAEQPADWDQQSERIKRPVPPLPAPVNTGIIDWNSVPDPPSFEIIVPISHIAEQSALWDVVWWSALIASSVLHVSWIPFFGLAGWQFWMWRKHRYKWGLCISLACLGYGLYVFYSNSR